MLATSMLLLFVVLTTAAIKAFLFGQMPSVMDMQADTYDYIVIGSGTSGSIIVSFHLFSYFVCFNISPSLLYLYIEPAAGGRWLRRAAA